MPRVDNTLDILAGARWFSTLDLISGLARWTSSAWFSTLDLISGYWQVDVDVKDREKMAFCTPDGFKVRPVSATIMHSLTWVMKKRSSRESKTISMLTTIS